MIHDERRRDRRVARQDRLLLQSFAEPLEGGAAECTSRGQICDGSRDGVRLRCDATVPSGRLVDLWVDVGAPSGKLFLSGRVRWSAPDADGTAHHLGVALDDRPATDLTDWRALIAAHMADADPGKDVAEGG